jgi:hypothetical protein
VEISLAGPISLILAANEWMFILGNTLFSILVIVMPTGYVSMLAMNLFAHDIGRSRGIALSF